VQLRYSFLFVTASLVCLCAQSSGAQTPTARKESIAVSANISKQQLEADDKLNGVIAKAEDAGRKGDLKALVERLQEALELVRGNPALLEQEDRVLRKAGQAQMSAKLFAEAERSFTELLALRKGDCKPTSRRVENCADAQFDLGIAQLYKGDFHEAVPSFRAALGSYEHAASNIDTEEYRMIKTKQQAEAGTFLAVSLFRIGRGAEAIPLLDKAILQFRLVQGNVNIQDAIRASSGEGLRQAEQARAAAQGK
jgi:tetratricopeptide (TPR) repeat protein